MTRYCIDANVLMNAAFVANGSSRELLVALSGDADHSVYMDEATWLQIEGVLERKMRQFRLNFEPFEVLKEFAADIGILHVPPSTDLLPDINRADRHVVAAAKEYDCVLVTDDHELVAEAHDCGIAAQTVLKAKMKLGRNVTLPAEGRHLQVHERTRTKISGHYYFRGTLNCIAKCATMHTAFDHEGRLCIAFDCQRSRWIATLDRIGVEIRVPFAQPASTQTAVAFSYSIDSRPGSIDRFGLAVGTSVNNRNQASARARGINWFLEPKGNLHLGSTRDKTGHLNGLITHISYGPGQIGQGTWRAILRDQTLLPSLWDADVLDAALLYINHRQQLPELSELF